MTTTKKLVIAVLALSLVLACTLGGTLAWLTATSGTVTNTFTYGEIEIELWENTVDNTGALTTTKDTDGLLYEKIVPGDEINKNPTVTVNAGSEKCYVYVLIENQLGTAATHNIDTTKWTKIGDRDTKVLYRYNGIVDATSEAQNLPVFTTLTFSGTLDNDDVAALAGKNVVISAYAHQEDNTDVDTANTAAIAWAGVTAIS